MKNKTLILTVAIVVGSILVGTFGAFGVAGATDKPEKTEDPRIISVSGTGIVTAKPDKFTVNFTISTQKKLARDAQQANDTKANAVIDAMKDAGVTEDDMQTTSYRLDTVYEWDKENRKNVLVGYRASYSLMVTRYDLADMGGIIDIATSNGVDNIGTIQYGIKNRERLTSEALRLAMKDAKGKADLALEVYDLEVLRVGNIHLNTYEPVARNSYEEKGDMDRAIGGAAPSAVAPVIIAGDLTFSVHVSVVFEF